MLKSTITRLGCKFPGWQACYQQLIDTYSALPVQGVHTSGCQQVLDKDHPGRKAVERYRTQQDLAATQQGPPPLQSDKFKMDSLYPTIETHSMLINGVRFDELPVIHIKATHNNTIITVTNGKGVPLANESGGSVGFRNARKGTNIAAQAAAISLAEKATKKGIDLVRICLKGTGPGRMPAVKGLQMSGMTIVSITDTTLLPHNGLRPKKQRR